MHVNLDTTVLGGLPVSVDAEVERHDPSVGYWFGVADYTLSSVNTGKKFGEWLYTRINGVPGEKEKLFDKILYALGANDEW